MDLRVAFTGTQGTGKTTLARRLALSLGPETLLLGSTTRLALSAGYSNNREFDYYSQSVMVATRIAWDLTAIVHDGPVVSERCLIDEHVYTLWGYYSYLDRGLELLDWESLTDVSLSMVQHLYGDKRVYDIIFRLPIPEGVDLEGDGARVADVEFQKEIDVLFDNVLSDNKSLPIVGVPAGTFDEQFEFIKREIEKCK